LRDLLKPKVARPLPRFGGSATGFLAGLLTNALVGAAALRHAGTGNAGLRLAARTTGQATLVPYAAYFARRRDSLLWAYAGAHVPHIPLIAVLMARHGHPQTGSPMRHISVYGGSVGYCVLLGLLWTSRVPPGRQPAMPALRTLAEWYLLLGPHSVPTAYGYAVKNRSVKLYGPIVAVGSVAVLSRLSGGRGASPSGAADR
jgi:hypothetical protein